MDVRHICLSFPRVLCFFVGCGALLACEPSARVPQTGRVSLDYRASSGSSTGFELANGSPQTISFRGSHHLFAAIEPMDTGWVCRPAGATGPDDAPFPLTDGSYTIIKLSPGETRKLEVREVVASKYRHGRCRLRLRLYDGTEVDSGEFEPE